MLCSTNQSTFLLCSRVSLGWPSVGLRLIPGADDKLILAKLLTSEAATSSPPKIDVYTSKTMPDRFHFNPANNLRIAPIYIVPRIGWAISTRHEHKVIMQGHYTPKGVSLSSRPLAKHFVNRELTDFFKFLSAFA